MQQGKKKKSKAHKLKGRRKKPLFIDNMIANTENPKESKEKPLELASEYIKIKGCIQQSTVFL